MSRSLALALSIALGAASVPAPAAAADELRYEVWPSAAITTGIGLVMAGELAARGALAPESCSWCEPGGFDRSITEALAWERHEWATTFSDVGLLLLPASAIVLGFAEDGAEDGAIDALVFGEAFAVNFLVTEALKFSVGRLRPMVLYLGEDHPKVSEHEKDWYVSFPSGHASAAFTSVAAMATITDLRGRDPTAIWLIGIPAATAVAYFRVAGYHHWTTDVLAGAALGTVVGLAVPRLLHGPGGLTPRDEEEESGAGVRPVQVFQLGGSF